MGYEANYMTVSIVIGDAFHRNSSDCLF
jgi:hypothetical protein